MKMYSPKNNILHENSFRIEICNIKINVLLENIELRSIVKHHIAIQQQFECRLYSPKSNHLLEPSDLELQICNI